MLQFACSRGISVSLETNGTMLNERIVDSLARREDPMVAVSLDGSMSSTHESIRGSLGSFDRACESIESLATRGIHVQVIMSLLRSNKEEVSSLVDLATNLGASSVAVNVVQPMMRGVQVHSSELGLTIHELVEFGQWVEAQSCWQIPVFYGHPLAFWPLPRLFQSSAAGTGCGILTTLGVLPDGSVGLCGIGAVLPAVVLGKPGHGDLATIWRTHPLITTLREGLPGRLKGICGSCTLKSACLGGCVGQKYYTSGDFTEPSWYCQSAFEAGLFPSSRIMGQ